MSELKRLKNPAQFFLDKGLLFEINRRVLHPLGLALEVILDERGDPIFGDVWDYREGDEGIRFADGTFTEGLEKWNIFCQEYANEATAKRKAVLGYVVQGDEAKEEE